ncbi:hypothetical protein WG66_004540 [Moniliophthora roreri]|nr:hypothetical protein WG66_004540 [Moniliophthora roreri]
MSTLDWTVESVARKEAPPPSGGWSFLGLVTVPVYGYGRKSTGTGRNRTVSVYMV